MVLLNATSSFTSKTHQGQQRHQPSLLQAHSSQRWREREQRSTICKSHLPLHLKKEPTFLPALKRRGLADPVSVTSRRLDPKYTPILVPASMAVAMSLVLSLVQTIVRIWFVPNLMSAWLTSFAIGVIVAVPTVILVAPHAQRLVGHLTGVSPRAPPENRR